MKLGDFLTSVPKPSAPPERIDFTVIHRNPHGGKTPVKAFAIFDLVTDKEEQAAELAALKSLQAQQGDGGLVPSELPGALERAHFLEVALRDADSPLERFATADELQTSVPRRELERLLSAYMVWAEKHYPKPVTKSDREQAKGDARGK